jgi:hypothetical protein
MKSQFLACIFCVSVNHLFAQSAVEKNIRSLDQQEAEATIKGDTALLQRLWSPSYLVNNPANTIVNVSQIRQLMKEGKISYSRFTRVVEKISVIDNVAITMGHEINEPDRATENSGKTVTRRYTNVWMKGKNGWQIIARQATITNMR